MLSLVEDQLMLAFPEVHPDAKCAIHFQRTLRLPDDNREYPLPPGLGRFSLKHVDDYAKQLPEPWRKQGGVFFSMYQAEALWLCFRGNYPFAIKVAAGKVNAITGNDWTNNLSATPQDYLVTPDQPWLDGFCVAKGRVRQFVAMPLGMGYTAEEQLKGAAEHGGIQIIAYPMKARVYEKLLSSRKAFVEEFQCMLSAASPDMGLAPGGLMRQEIYADKYGIDAWDTKHSSRCFVHILNSFQYQVVTGERPARMPPTAEDYTNAGLPWFDYCDANLSALEGAAELAQLDGVAAMGIKQGQEPLPENDPVDPKVTIQLGKKKEVKEGKW